MKPDSRPGQSAPASQLVRDSYRHLVLTLRAALPTPVPNTPEALSRRDHAAIAEVASLRPANPAEAALAAQYVAANAQAMDTLGRARSAGTDHDLARKCAARAIDMMRQAEGAIQLLLRVQAARQDIEADNTATWTESGASGLAARILAGAPAANAPSVPPPATTTTPESASPRDTQQAAVIAAAEEYARVYPLRAAMIRRLRRVPEHVSFAPPEAAVVGALITGQKTLALKALDRRAATLRAV